MSRADETLTAEQEIPAAARRVIRTNHSAQSAEHHWMALLRAAVLRVGEEDLNRTNYAWANARMVQRAAAGLGPDVSGPASGRSPLAAPSAAPAGARMVANIPSVHVPAFCTASRGLGSLAETKPYKNAYDLLGQAAHLGEPRQVVSDKRRLVDSALPVPGRTEQIYFCAVELNGTGVRFYGDICLVLAASETPPDTIILERNSYDLIRPPILFHWHRTRKSLVEQGLWTSDPAPPTTVSNNQLALLRAEARRMSGLWGRDLGILLAIKALDAPGSGGGTRRFSTRQISDSVLDDEDYVEVLKLGSFGARQLQEVRMAAADVAADARVAERLRGGPKPFAASILWRNRRRRAELALARIGPALRIVTSRGRMK